MFLQDHCDWLVLNVDLVSVNLVIARYIGIVCRFICYNLIIGYVLKTWNGLFEGHCQRSLRGHGDLASLVFFRLAILVCCIIYFWILFHLTHISRFVVKISSMDVDLFLLSNVLYCSNQKCSFCMQQLSVTKSALFSQYIYTRISIYNTGFWGPYI